MKRSILLVLFVALAAFFLFTTQTPNSVAQETDSSTKKIRALMEQRANVLQKNAEAVEAQHRSGTVGLDDLLNAKTLWIEAKLDLATSDDERIELLNTQLENARAIEERVAALQKIGARGGSDTELYLATAERLSVEIRLATVLRRD